MFSHLFNYKLKVLTRNKSLLFWTLLFPFLLGTFFQLALGNIGKAYEMPEIAGAEFPVSFVEDITTEKVDFTINYFFTLVAMACLYGSLIGLEVTKDSEANLGARGARINMAPVSKVKVLCAGLFAGYLIQLVTLLLLFLFLIFGFKVRFGAQILPTILLVAIGALAGTALGTFVGVSNRLGEEAKIGILIAVIMACCFFAGMMGPVELKNFFDTHLPVLAKINPVNTITDGLYALFAYDDLAVFYECLGRISVFAILCIGGAAIFTRRKKYDRL